MFKFSSNKHLAQHQREEAYAVSMFISTTLLFLAVLAGVINTILTQGL